MGAVVSRAMGLISYPRALTMLAEAGFDARRFSPAVVAFDEEVWCPRAIDARTGALAGWRVPDATGATLIAESHVPASL